MKVFILRNYLILFILILLLVFLYYLLPPKKHAEKYMPPPEPIVINERLAPTEGHPKGGYRIQMEDILFEISSNQFLIQGENHFDMLACWLTDPPQLIDSYAYDCHSYGQSTRLQFRAQRIPSRGYWKSLNRDLTKLENYSDHSVYVLQPSTEFPELQEYYLLEYEYAYQFLLDYTDTGRGVKQRIHCSPDFRENEKIISASEGMGNMECQYSLFLSPHIYLTVKFSSRIMPQFKLFEKQIHEFVNSLIINRQK